MISIKGVEGIDYDEFRKEYKISSSDCKTIIKSLGLRVERVLDKQYVVGENRFGVENHYYLKSAVYEYRRTGRWEKTKNGEWMEYEITTEDGIKQIGVSNIPEHIVKPISPSYRVEPNKTSESMLVKKTDIEKMRVALESATSPASSIEQDNRNGLILIETITENILNHFVAAVKEIKNEPEQKKDTLQPQRALMEAETHSYLLSTQQLGEIIGMSTSTISSKKTGFKRMGFVFEKVKEGNSIYWKVKKY
jgi:hypothetical protein